MAYRFNAEKYEQGKREREEARVRLAIQQIDAMPDSAGRCYFIGCYLDGEQQGNPRSGVQLYADNKGKRYLSSAEFQQLGDALRRLRR